MNKRWTVYCHTHAESGRRYVGLTVKTMLARWNGHINLAKRSNGRRSHFAAAIRKYGKGAFEHEVVRVFDSLEDANTAEKALIRKWRTRDPQFGFNLAKGGQHVPHPIRKNPWDDPIYRAKQMVAIGKQWSDPEARVATSNAVRQKWQDPEYREKVSAASKEVHSRPGMKEKARACNLGKKLSTETRRRIGSVVRGRKTSEETKRRISEASRGRLHSPEAKRKISTAAKLAARLGRRASENPKTRKYVITDGQITHKVCSRHGVLPLSDCYVTTHQSGKPRILCKICSKKQRCQDSDGHSSLMPG